jgi:drug/metabolite transporter (DMT)-like permease
MWLVRNTSASAVSTYAYVNPLVAMLLGWIFLDERLHPRVALAAALILGGVVLMQTGRKGREGEHHPRKVAESEP